LAKERVAALVGTSVTVGSARGKSFTWKVVEKHVPPNKNIMNAGFDQKKKIGLRDFDMGHHRKSEVLAFMFLYLSFFNWKEKVDIINEKIIESRKKVNKFSHEEFLIGIGLLIGSAEFSQRGNQLFGFKNSLADDSDEEDDFRGAEYWPSICLSPKFEQFMSLSRFKEFHSLLPCIWEDESRKEDDP
jgi:hypothetical protein